MQIRNNRGELIGEINTIIRPSEGVIITNTVYSQIITKTKHVRAQEFVHVGLFAEAREPPDS